MHGARAEGHPTGRLWAEIARSRTHVDPDPHAAVLGVLEGFLELPADLAKEERAKLLEERETPYGRVTHLKPVLQLSETPPFWARPPVPLGSCPPSWP